MGLGVGSEIMAKLPTWRTLSKEKRTNIEYLRGFNVVCIERTRRVFFEYFGEIVGEFLTTGPKLKKGLNLICLQMVSEFCEDIKAGKMRYPVVITKNFK